MPRHAYIDFEHLKQTFTIEQILAHYGLLDQLNPSGDKLYGTCPLHKGNNDRQFEISPKNNRWHCYGSCKTGGDIIALVARIENLPSMNEAAHRIVDIFDFIPEKPTRASPKNASNNREKADTEIKDNDASTSLFEVPTPDAAIKQKNKPYGERLDYLIHDHSTLIDRGILSDIAHELGIGFANKGILRGHIAIPVQDETGLIIAYIGAATDHSQVDFKYPRNFKPEFEIFGRHLIPEGDDYDDVLALKIVTSPLHWIELFEQGIEHVIALMGETISQTQFDKLVIFARERGYKEIQIIAPNLSLGLYKLIASLHQIETLNVSLFLHRQLGQATELKDHAVETAK